MPPRDHDRQIDEEDPVTAFWSIVVYAYVVVSLVFVGIGLYWLRPHH